MKTSTPVSTVEKIKQNSNGLRGTLVDSLHNEITGSISDDDQAIIKFHGLYQQDDRDVREQRASKKLERLFSFMIRLRLPGGFLTSEQWLAIQEISGRQASDVIKITSRQTIQLHGIIKSKIKPSINAFSKAKLDSIATCGDINRNVVCSAHPAMSRAHSEIFSYADKISTLLMPSTRAYYEIWLDEELLLDKRDEVDPLYEDRYLPRKFKIAIAIPPNNDVDVFANDIGLIAIVENDILRGFNIAVGGGLSATHGNKENYPRLGSVIGFCDDQKILLNTIYEILCIQRDFGNRLDRKLARLKYTIDKFGLDWFVGELEKRINSSLLPAQPYIFTKRSDDFGWFQNVDGKWYFTLFVENGRIHDGGDTKIKQLLSQIALTHKANFRFTCNQNVIIADIEGEDRPVIDCILNEFGVHNEFQSTSALRRNSMACVAFNTCPLALAEGQRYLPTLISKIEPILSKYHLGDEDIIIRMTGCPNACARPVVAEIGLVGTSYGKYNLHLGGDHQGTRLNTLFKENLEEHSILKELDILFEDFSLNRIKAERFGDFIFRKLSLKN